MIQKKICMLGSFAVGKTSLIDRYVRSIFSDKYLTTIGVKVDKREIQLDNQDIKLIIWDLNGADEIDTIKVNYLRGMSGYLLVLDSTRKATLDIALDIKKIVEENVGDLPFILVLNKSDLLDQIEINENDNNLLDKFKKEGFSVIKTSAKTGEGVDEAFILLTQKILEADK